ncbi:MAG: guanine deaminase [Paracoccaceae bacterium]
MGDITLLCGQVLSYRGDPFGAQGPDAAQHIQRGAVAIRDGLILDLGEADVLRAAYPQADVKDYGTALISAGFIDAHVHYPQTGIIASWGSRLIEWLNKYTFPEEMRFDDPAYAAKAAALYFDLSRSNGTTSMCSFGTIHPASVDAFFTEAQKRGQRAITGRTCMDRETAPIGLRDTAKTAYDESAALIRKWHGRDRLSYAITPRFSPTSTQEQLESLGALWAENPDCLMQTHLSEQTDEIDWVRGLYPDARDYLDTYEAHGLLREGGLFGHAIHLAPRETARLREAGGALIHCPTSNTFIGSGLFDMAARIREGQIIGLATDTGGGSSFSMLRTMAAAYEIGQLSGTPLHPAQLWWLATAGSARALRMSDKIGNISKGMEADLIVVDLASTAVIEQRSSRSEDFWEALFPTIMMGDDRAISAVWIGGKQAA